MTAQTIATQAVQLQIAIFTLPLRMTRVPVAM